MSETTMPATDPPDRAPEKSIVKVALTALAGTSIEWYDFFLYGTAAALVFPTVFFPEDLPPLVGLIASFSTFAVGFIARPVRGCDLRPLRRPAWAQACPDLRVGDDGRRNHVDRMPSDLCPCRRSRAHSADIAALCAGTCHRRSMGRSGFARYRERAGPPTRFLRQLCPDRCTGRRVDRQSRFFCWVSTKHIARGFSLHGGGEYRFC